ncbi:hypothetical protein [Clostridium botulinum]|nr:hypothetical protein [Clostridium botulinum]APH23897.1 hypothetical protein NPD1_759 [Clostridium botulinum]
MKSYKIKIDEAIEKIVEMYFCNSPLKQAISYVSKFHKIEEE